MSRSVIIVDSRRPLDIRRIDAYLAAMNTQEAMKALERLGTAQTKKTWMRHGCPEPLFGVKVADMKTIVKKIKKDTALAKELFRTGNGDAMYLAGLIGDGSEMTRKDLEEWADLARWPMVSEYTVPWVAAEHPEAWEIALGWIDSKDEKIATTGWCTLGGIVATREDRDLDLKAVEKLLDRVVKSIKTASNRSRYVMNGFIIAVGAFVKPLTSKALAAAARIGKVEVDMGDTACKVPDAAEYIKKCTVRGYKKRKTMKC